MLRTWLAVVGTCSVLAGCGDDSQPKGAVECLKAAKLDGVEPYEPNVWRGFAPDKSIVFVAKLTTKTDATMTKQENADRWAFAVDRYLITGPAKDADGSFTMTVADCMRTGRAQAG